MQLFNRKAAVVIGDVRVEGLRMSFQVTNSNDSEANTASVEISNLSEDTRGRILSQADGKKPQFIIEAGYKEVFGEIYKGKALEVSSTKTRDGWTLLAEAKDGQDELSSIVNVSMAPNVTMDKVVQRIAEGMGVKFKKAIARIQKGDINGGVTKFLTGVVAYGRGMTELDTIADKLGFEWSVQGGELEVRLPDETNSGESYTFDEDTGLVGSPQFVFDDSKRFVEFTTLLVPGLRPNGLVELESREFAGAYKMTRIDHTGDTHGDVWNSLVTARGV